MILKGINRWSSCCIAFVYVSDSATYCCTAVTLMSDQERRQVKNLNYMFHVVMETLGLT